MFQTAKCQASDVIISQALALHAMERALKIIQDCQRHINHQKELMPCFWGQNKQEVSGQFLHKPKRGCSEVQKGFCPCIVPISLHEPPSDPPFHSQAHPVDSAQRLWGLEAASIDLS